MGGFTPSAIFWTQAVVTGAVPFPPPVHVPSYSPRMSFSISSPPPTARRFSSNAAHALAFSANYFLHYKKSLLVRVHSVRLEPTKVILRQCYSRHADQPIMASHRVCMVYSSRTCFLGRICVLQILHNLSQRQVRNCRRSTVYSSIDHELSEVRMNSLCWSISLSFANPHFRRRKKAQKKSFFLKNITCSSTL